MNVTARKTKRTQLKLETLEDRAAPTGLANPVSPIPSTNLRAHSQTPNLRDVTALRGEGD